MSVLVTGGAGFIGSHLCDRLIAENEKVICLDNFDPYYNPRLKMQNIKHNLKKRKFVFIQGDIRDPKLLNRIFEKYKIFKVAHLAARAGVRASFRDPLLYQDINIRGTMQLLEICAKHRIENFIFGSSSSVYGELKVPFKENMIPRPISPYAATKMCAENLVQAYHSMYGLPCSILRFFTVYGPRQRPDMAIYKFTKAINEEKTIKLFGYGRLKRDYTYIDDIVEGILRALDEPLECKTINLGSARPLGLYKIVSLLEIELGKKAKTKLEPKPLGDVYMTWADISNARRLLGYKPKTKIEEGIKKFVSWYKSAQRL